ncbi:hypothetical protein V2I01_12115 [Micromonospora sp. BRA006-A]|nr:hypothetical protein [Micromonospora sp. BRA006-A]
MTEPGGVDVWTVHLDRDVDAARWLGAAELRRAADIGDPDGRRRFVAAHAALNGILAGRLDLRPTATRCAASRSGGRTCRAARCISASRTPGNGR